MAEAKVEKTIKYGNSILKFFINENNKVGVFIKLKNTDDKYSSSYIYLDSSDITGIIELLGAVQDE